MSRASWRFETRSIHAGHSPDPTTKAVAVPIYQTVAYAFDNAQHGATNGRKRCSSSRSATRPAT